MIWPEVPSSDVDAHINLYPPAQEVLLTLLNDHNISSAILYALNNTTDVNISILPINNNEMFLNVTDKISFMKLNSRNNSILHNLY